MSRSSGPLRTTAQLSEAVHHWLNMYALAAGAAGVGALALTQPAEAKVVYTPAHVKLVLGQPFALDLNHDGIVDFYLLHAGQSEVSGGTNSLDACNGISTYNHNPFCGSNIANSQNAIRVTQSIYAKWAVAVRPEARIQRGDRFLDGNQITGIGMGAVSSVVSSHTQWSGPWANKGKGVKNRYLGMKFKINGRFHFGWARLNFTTTRNAFTATLTGYAYETIPGKAIVAGQTKESITKVPEASLIGPTPARATLGALAIGAQGLSIWRRPWADSTR